MPRVTTLVRKLLTQPASVSIISDMASGRIADIRRERKSAKLTCTLQQECRCIPELILMQDNGRMPVQPTERLSLFGAQLLKVFDISFPCASHHPAALCMFCLYLLVSVIALDVFICTLL